MLAEIGLSGLALAQSTSEPVKLGLEHRAVGRLVREEELELELVPQPHRLIPPVGGRAEQHPGRVSVPTCRARVIDRYERPM